MASDRDDRTAVLVLAGPHSPIKVESHSRTLAAFDADERVDLQVPTSLRGDDLGGLGAVAQLLVTWSRRPTPGVLRTYVPGAATDDEADDARGRAVRKLVQSDHGVLALLLAAGAVDVKGRSIAGHSTSAVAARLADAGRASTARRGQTITLIAADHRAENAPFALYQPSTAGGVAHAIRDREEFVALAHDLLRVVGVGVGGQRPSPDQLESLGTVLYQLFKNTHDWARTSAAGAPYSRSVRVLRSEYVGDDLSIHLKHARGDTSLTRYLGHDTHVRDERADAKKDMRRFLEVSIFDSGPGLAARVLRTAGIDDPTLEQEHAALLECLRKHMTSSGQRGRGNGLHLVQELLTGLHGYLRVRSGRLALVRDYVNDPYTRQDALEPRLSDWSTGSSQPTAMAALEGTYLSFVIPIRLTTTRWSPDTSPTGSTR